MVAEGVHYDLRPQGTGSRARQPAVPTAKLTPQQGQLKPSALPRRATSLSPPRMHSLPEEDGDALFPSLLPRAQSSTQIKESPAAAMPRESSNQDSKDGMRTPTSEAQDPRYRGLAREGPATMPAMPDERQYAAPEPYQVKQEKMEPSTKQDTGAPAFGIAPEPSTAELLQKLKEQEQAIKQANEQARYERFVHDQERAESQARIANLTTEREGAKRVEEDRVQQPR